MAKMFAVAEENLATPRKSRGVRYRLRASDTRHGHGTPEKNARGISRRAPRLQRGSCLSTSQRLHYDSYTQISQYLRCPRSYRYRYLDGWREKETRAPMIFGRSFENALGTLFRKEDPAPHCLRNGALIAMRHSNIKKVIPGTSRPSRYPFAGTICAR